jgi:protoporphyrinogen oxidase
MKIGIVGGGVMGLVLAHHLADEGHQVLVFERAPQVGGLATWHDFEAFVWDRFYHVILPSDSALLGLLNRVGLADKVRWSPTQTGYYVDQRFYPLSTSLDFLRFPLLSMWSKGRLAATILYCSRIDDWRRLEKVTVEQFLVRTSGRATFEKFWKPLLLAKLGENYRRVSAVFIWSYIKRLFSARDASAQREHLGYVSGGYRTVFERMLERIRARGGEVRVGVDVERVRAEEARGLVLTSEGRQHRFDKVVFTGPMNALRTCVAVDLVSVPPSRGDVEYLGVVCPALITRRPLVPYYILNIADSRVPFTGVIGMSSLVSTDETNGLYLNYLPKYVLSDDDLLGRGDDEIREQFMSGARLMFPTLTDDDVVAVHVNRAAKVQPLQVLDYSRIVQSPRTRHPDFYVVNTAQFVNNTLNNNEVVRSAEAFLKEYAADFAPRSDDIERAEPSAFTHAGAGRA